MNTIISSVFLLVILSCLQSDSEACRKINSCEVVYDPGCSTGFKSRGCNAGGQG